jgi:transcriptional regulator with XRE-family HTH domain
MANIKVKIDALEKLQRDYSLNDTELAIKIGIDRTQLWRLKTDRSVPGEDFIAKILTAFPDKKFEDLFFLKKMSHGFQAAGTE